MRETAQGEQRAPPAIREDIDTQKTQQNKKERKAGDGTRRSESASRETRGPRDANETKRSTEQENTNQPKKQKAKNGRENTQCEP